MNTLPDSLPEELSELMSRAEAGDARACFELATYFLNECEPSDPESALPWVLEGVKMHDANCLCLLGMMHLYGDGVEKSDEAAVECLRAAAELGHPHAALNLAQLMMESRGGLECHHVKALTLLKQAYSCGIEANIPALSDAILTFLLDHADAEHPELCFQYGWACYNALFCPQDFDRAARYYRLAAEKGHAEAQYELGLCYLEGKGVPRDSAEAERWNRRAAEQGHPMAEYEEGSFYAMGDGVTKDDAEAFSWFSRAAAHDHPGANAALATCYEEGMGTERDEDKALEYMTRSMELGSPKGYYMLGRRLVYGEGVRQNIRKGMEMLVRAERMGHNDARREVEHVLEGLKEVAEQGDAAAQAVLGFIDAEILPEPRPEEAFRWFSCSAEQEHPRGLFGLGLCYLNAWGTPADVEKGMELISRAAQAGEPDALATYGYVRFRSADDDEIRRLGLDFIRRAAEDGSEMAQNFLADLEEETEE